MNYFRLNDSNTSLGQLGLALLKNPAKGASKLILYRTKEQILSTLQLTDSVRVLWKPPYLQYHDDSNGFWSLLFTSDSDTTAFFAKLEEVCTIDRANAKTVDINVFETEAIASKPTESTNSTKTVVPTTSEVIKSSDDVDSSTKSAVVNRVAKIGHQLPNFKLPIEDDSDSTQHSDTEKVPFQHTSKSIILQDAIGSFASSSFAHGTRLPPKPANISVALQPSIWSNPSSIDLSSFASENRMQNTEVRMNLSKLDSKLDRVLENIERK